MPQNYEQDYRVISSQLSQIPNEVLQELGGEEAEIASMAAAGISLEDVCKQKGMQPDQVWATLHRALDRLQGTRWAVGPSGDIRPLDADELGHPKEGI